MIGGIGSAIQSRRQGRRGRAFAREERQHAQAFSAREAQLQRDFMSTHYQRSTEDMRAAGLNPMMMYGSGPGGVASGSAASSSGGSAPGETTTGFKPSFDPLSIATAKQLNANSKLLKAKADTEKSIQHKNYSSSAWTERMANEKAGLEKLLNFTGQGSLFHSAKNRVLSMTKGLQDMVDRYKYDPSKISPSSSAKKVKDFARTSLIKSWLTKKGWWPK